MSLSTRELYLALRVRDEGTRNMQRFAQEITRTGTAARVASLKAQADSIREQANLKRSEIATKRVELARLKENEASRAQIRGLSSKIVEMQKEAVALEKQAQGYDRQATALQRAAQQQNHLTGTLTQTGVALETVGVAFGFLGVTGVAAMKGVIDVTVEWQRQVAATLTQIDGFGESLGNLSDIGLKIAKTIAVPFEEVQPALFDIFSSLEISTKDAEKLLTLFSKAAVAGQTDLQAASRATIGIMNAFNVPVERVNHILDLQFQLVQEGIGSYSEWVARIGMVSPSAVRAEQSIEGMLAALAVTTRLGIPASRSATAVSRAFDAMSNPKAIEDMEALGIKVRNADGAMRPFNEILREFRGILLKMPKEDRVGAILETFQGAGSTIEARRFLQSMLLGEGSLELFEVILKEMEKDTGSFENAYAIMADTTAMKSVIVSNKWKVMKEQLGEGLIPAFEGLLGIVERVFNWFDKLSPSTKSMIAQFLMWGSVLAIVVGALLTLLGLLAVFLAAISATWAVLVPVVLAVTVLVAGVLGLAAALAVAWAQSASFRENLKQTWDQVKEGLKIFKDTSEGIWKAFKEKLLPPLERLMQVVEDKVIPAFTKFQKEVWDVLKPKLEEAGRIITSIVTWAFEQIGKVIDNVVIPAIQKLTAWWERNKSTLEPLIAILAQVVKWALIIGAVIVGVLVVAFIGPLIAGVLAVVGVFILFVETGQFLWTVIMTLWEGLKKIGQGFKDIGVAIWHALYEGWQNVVNFFANTIPNFFSTKTTEFLNFGKNIIQGLADGIKDKFSTVLGVIKSLTGGVIEAFKTLLGITSPSKVMAEIGAYSAEGYILGFQRTMAQGLSPSDAFLGIRPAALAPNEAAPVDVAGQSRALMPANEGKKQITNNITIYTQELDAREQAGRLGWELAGRM